ncbi:hypothetical protein CDQ84_09545 [Clostridium thermosuccinogenes]|uniref:Uncharacterized protein n=3 Tax=Clostridium thermosuccinogenes TaxID=84032 RepID=A0A2K2FJX7_9CLOT|nr:hypothetical protein [Pseudoclostridium thermosuccinogenes]AUS98249.1 hypothetical protein CDO33_18370 [Pseudoclostridium thermosuccinogenes]PNT97197.1 hypothetical protein CDQ85_09395 [Pseudoclostridium thermosuccinogenes]PNT99089.1 hypothetical protein CDQ84_09545 [Pseudoclostridium thermosuccinogenes]
MIKKLAIFFVLGISIGLLAILATGPQGSFNSEPDKVAVSKDSNIVLDFADAGVKIEGWDKDFVQISALAPTVDNGKQNYQGLKYKIATDKNNISLTEYSMAYSTIYSFQSWMPLSQFEKYKDQSRDVHGLSISMSNAPGDYSFLINVPKDIPLEITAGFIKASGCTLFYTKAERTVLKDSNIIKGFISEGDIIEVKDCTINSDSSFNNKSLEMKGNKLTNE